MASPKTEENMSMGQINVIVQSLIESAHDKQESVTHSICKSLHCLGQHEPNLVLSNCLNYLQKTPKVPLPHRILLLNVMEHICKSSSNELNPNLVSLIVKHAISEILTSKEIVPEWQSAASGILVSLGRSHNNQVMDGILSNFQPETVPHFFIVSTLANLATTNVFGMVPFIKALLGTMIPMLLMIKHDNMKYVFAQALASFSEAIHDYIMNIEKAPDPTVTKEVFSSEIAIGFDILHNSMLHSRDSKVKSKVVEALGHMSLILEQPKLEEALPKVIPEILNLYKRQHESHVTTMGLGLMLNAALKLENGALDPLVDNIWSTVFPHVCSIPDYSQPAGIKNQNEVLRCFTILAPYYIDRMLHFILLKLENSSEPVRIGVLTVLKHLINSCEVHLNHRISGILMGLRAVLHDPNNKVKKILAQVVVALAHHGYLDIDGGKPMVLFLVRQCALKDDVLVKRPTDPDYVSNEALRAMCENVLQLLTTTVDSMDKVLWPDLLECLVQEEYTLAVGPICKSLAYLVTKHKEQGDFEIDYSTYPSLPMGQALFGRLVILLANPNSRGANILQLLKVIAPFINKTLAALWDQMTPKLSSYLENIPEWDQAEWESQLLELVQKSLEELDSEEWTIKFCRCLLDQMSLYKECSEDKMFYIKVLGTTVKRVANKALVNQALDTIFEGLQHHLPREREGCAQAIGLCSSSHLDVVLMKLERVAKEEGKKYSGLFSLLKDFKGGDPDRVRATIILCYGHVAWHASGPLILTRIETPILRCITKFYQESKESCVKDSLLQTIRLIADSLHPQHASLQNDFKIQTDLLALVCSILAAKNEQPLYLTTCSLALKAAASLVKLDVSNRDDYTTLLEQALVAVFSVHMPSTPTNSNPELLLKNAVESLHELLRQLLIQKTTSVNLMYLIKNLHVWMESTNSLERYSAMQAAACLLTTYLKHINSQTFTLFPQLGQLLGLLCPKCTDSVFEIRQAGLQVVMLLLEIDAKSQGKKFKEPPTIDLLRQLLNEKEAYSDYYNSSISPTLRSFSVELTKVLSHELPSDQLMPFIKYLIAALKDPQTNSSIGSVIMLNELLKTRGNELRSEVANIWEEIQIGTPAVTCQVTRAEVFQCVRILARLHLAPMMTALLSTNWPLNDIWIDSWSVMASDQELAPNIMTYLLDLLTDHQLTEQVADPKAHKQFLTVAKIVPLTALNAINEMFRMVEMEPYALTHFDNIFSILLITLGAYVNAYYISSNGQITTPKQSPEHRNKMTPSRHVVETFKRFLLCIHEDELVMRLVEGRFWAMLYDEDQYHEGVVALASELSNSSPRHLPKLLARISPVLSSNIESQKIVVVAFMSELLCGCYEGKATILEPLMTNLLSRLEDPCHLVRKLSIHGLGSISGLDQFQKYSNTVLQAMMAGLDDKNDPQDEISLEAMNGLCNIVSQVPFEEVSKLLVTIILSLRRMFDKSKPLVRAAAFRLLAKITLFVDESNQEYVLEEFHHSMVTLLLHLNDPEKRVSKACREALEAITESLDCQPLSSLFQKQETFLHYGEFLNTISKVLVSNFIDKINYYATASMAYFKSPSPLLQSNAILFLGFLMGNLPIEKHDLIQKEKICGGMIVLLKDENPDVRIKTADALSLLYSY